MRNEDIEKKILAEAEETIVNADAEEVDMTEEDLLESESQLAMDGNKEEEKKKKEKIRLKIIIFLFSLLFLKNKSFPVYTVATA